MGSRGASCHILGFALTSITKMYREFLLKLIRPVGIHAQTFGFDDAVVVDAPHLAPESAGALSVARTQAQLGGDALVAVLVAVLAIEQLK